MGRARRRGPGPAQRTGGWQAGLSTTQRGLGWGHQQTRKALLEALRDGDPCARCAAEGRYHPMFRRFARYLEVDDFPGRRFGGPQVKKLSWRRCNRSAGATAGNRMRACTPTRGQAAYNRW